MKRKIFWTLAALAACVERGVAQQGGELTGVSAISAGRAGAGTAAGDSVLDTIRNPAALAWMFGDDERHQKRGAVGEIVGRAVWSPASVTDSQGNTFRADNRPTGAPAWIAWATELSEETYLGLSVMPTIAVGANVDMRTELNVGTPTRTERLAIANSILQIGFQPTFAWRSDDVAVGFGASIRHTSAALRSATELDVLETFQGEVPFAAGTTWGEFLSGPPFGIKTIQTNYDGDVSEDFAALFNMGIMWQATDDTRLTAFYRAPSTRMQLRGEVDVNLTPELGPILNAVGLDGRGHYDLLVKDVNFPDQAGIGVLHEATPDDRLLFDVVWTNWSRTFKGWDVLLFNSTNGDFGDLVGGNGDTVIDLGFLWEDTLAISVGYEHDVDESLTLRGGLGYASDPTTGPVSPGSHVFNSWHAAAGASFWGQEGGGDWHFAFSMAFPDSHVTGNNEVLTDFSFNTLRVAFYSVVVGYTLEF